MVRTLTPSADPGNVPGAWTSPQLVPYSFDSMVPDWPAMVSVAMSAVTSMIGGVEPGATVAGAVASTVWVRVANWSPSGVSARQP